jgi:nuclear GTP-binding protein
VGTKPGVTRSVTEINLDKNITLIDCPGIIFASDMSQADAALRNCIKFEQLEDCTLPIQAILKRCPAAQLAQIYNITIFSNEVEFLHRVAIKRGKLRPGGIPDIELAAQVVFYDWNSGKIPYYTIPPESEFAANRLPNAQIVSEWSQAFNLKDIMDIESNVVLGELPSSTDNFVKTISVPVPVAEDYSHLDTQLDEPEKMNEEEEEDSSSEIEKPKQKIKINVGQTAIAPVKEKKVALIPKEKIFSEQISNPSINKEIRKSLKLEKKEEKKAQKSTPAEPIVEDQFDFNKDFWQI